MKEGNQYRAVRRNAAKAWAKLSKAKLRDVWPGADTIPDTSTRGVRASRYSPHNGLREMARRRRA